MAALFRIPSFIAHCCCLLLFLFHGLRTVRAAKDLADDDTKIIAQVLDWVRENKGYVNEKVEVRNMGGGLSGMFAKEPLQEGEVVSSIPWHLILKPDDLRNDQEDAFCGTIRTALDSITKAPDQQTPFDKYLAGRSRSHVPAFWSKQGKALLKELLGGEHVPRAEFETEARDWLVEDCEISSAEEFGRDEKVLNALMIAITRGEGPKTDLLVPFHDIVNHRNGKQWINTAIRFKDGVECGLVTTKKVQAGEQLQSSYNQCPWCNLYRNPHSQDSFFVTQHMFVHYGFVELMPQRWVFPQARLLFDIDEKDGGGLQARFAVPPSNRGLSFLQNELKRLWEFEQCYKEHPPTVPEHELTAIWEYHKAATTAFTQAMASSIGQVSDKVWDLGIDEWYREDEEDRQSSAL